MSNKYPTAARKGWGQQAAYLNSKQLSNIGKLGPLGGRLDDSNNNNKKSHKRRHEKSHKSHKHKHKTLDNTNLDMDDDEEDDNDKNYISNFDLFLYTGFFIFAAGLIIAILVLPLPNIWVNNEEIIYVAAGLILLGDEFHYLMSRTVMQ